MNARLNVCIVAHFAYPAFAGGGRGLIGGVERQTSLMARWLAARGHDVSLVTWDEGQADGARVDGVKLLKLCRSDAGVPGVRFLHPRWTSLAAALRRADADVYYQNCAEYVTGQVALWARLHRRGFVYSVASDQECKPALPALARLRERWLFRYGLRRADRIIVQTARQQGMLAEGFGLDACVLPMPCPGPEDEFVPPAPAAPGRFRTLWLGRVVAGKRPELLLEVAAACPDVAFDLVGPWEEAPFARALLERAAGLPNLTVRGPAARAEVPGFLASAHVLCATSDDEGFPNTYLEAWSHGVPVVGCFDPDGLIASAGLGVAAADAAGLAAAIRRLASSPEAWLEASRRSRRHWLDNHSVGKALPRFERLLLEAAASVGAPSGARARALDSERGS